MALNINDYQAELGSLKNDASRGAMMAAAEASIAAAVTALQNFDAAIGALSTAVSNQNNSFHSMVALGSKYADLRASAANEPDPSGGNFQAHTSATLFAEILRRYNPVRVRVALTGAP